MHSYFQSNLTPRYHPVLIQESHTLLRNLLAEPERFAHYARTCGVVLPTLA